MRQPVHVLFANMPELTYQILAGFLSNNQNFMIDGLVQGDVSVLVALKDGADVVVLGVSDVDKTPGIYSHILSEYPFVKILTVNTSADEAKGYWLGVRNKRYLLPSSTALIQILNDLYETDIMD